MRLGLVEPALVIADGGEVLVRGARVRGQPQRRLPLRARLPELPRPAVEAAQRDMRLDRLAQRRRETERELVALGRFVRPVERLVGAAQTHAQVGGGAAERARALERLRRKVLFAQRLKRFGHQPPRARVVHVERQRRVGALKRLGRAARGEQRRRKPAQRRGGVRIGLQRGFVEVDCFVAPALLRHRLGQRQMRGLRQACAGRLPFQFPHRHRHVYSSRASFLRDEAFADLAGR